MRGYLRFICASVCVFISRCRSAVFVIDETIESIDEVMI